MPNVPADIVDGLVVNHEGTVGVFQGGVGGEDGIVWLNHSSGYLRGGIHSKLQLGLLSIVDRQPLHQQGGESGSGTTTKGVEDEESLETSALISQLPESVKDEVDNLFPDGVVTTGVVVGSIFLTSDKLFWVEQLAVGASTDLICNGQYTDIDYECIEWKLKASRQLKLLFNFDEVFVLKHPN